MMSVTFIFVSVPFPIDPLTVGREHMRSMINLYTSPLNGKTFRFGYRGCFGFERADIMLFSVGQPFREEPPPARAVADTASHRADTLGEEPAGVDSILFPRDALICHGTLQVRSFVGNILSTRFDRGNNSSSAKSIQARARRFLSINACASSMTC